MSAPNRSRAIPHHQPAHTMETLARLAVIASVFAWLAVLVALFWR